MFTDYIIINKTPHTNDAFYLQVKPKEPISITRFMSGQYCKIKNPNFIDPNEEHPFSIASSPNNKKYLEFYVRAYGDWTKALQKKPLGAIVQIALPFGNFTLDKTTDRNSVFLVGGVGISPVISMLRFIQEQGYKGNYTLIYGNRTQQTIAYKKELDTLCKRIKTCNIVHIFSDLAPNDSWRGYRGFVTKEILEKEVNFSLSPTFFVIGPPIFIEKMNEMLRIFSVKKKQIKQELI